MTLIAPRRPVKTYARYGRETYADTGRPVDERLGSHVVLWIVDDPELWAKAIEAEADAEAARWPARDRGLAEFRRSQRYEGAAQVRAEGPRRSWRGPYHDAASAHASVRELYRAHPNPGVRYEVAEITDVGACPACHRPIIQADGEWRHHTGGFPAECSCHPEPAPAKKERRPGEWEIDTRGYMICGYCNERESWPVCHHQLVLGYWELTGYHMLGIEWATGALVVLAEATTLTGETIHLPHHCQQIPADVRATYAPAKNGA
jgi:hypothetical protein